MSCGKPEIAKRASTRRTLVKHKSEGSVFVALGAEKQAANRSWMRGARVERCGRLQNARRKYTLDAAFLFGSHCMAPEQAAALGASGR